MKHLNLHEQVEIGPKRMLSAIGMMVSWGLLPDTEGHHGSNPWTLSANYAGSPQAVLQATRCDESMSRCPKFRSQKLMGFGYGSIPINTIFRGMNIHLPAILMFTRGTRFWHTAKSQFGTPDLGWPFVRTVARVVAIYGGADALPQLKASPPVLWRYCFGWKNYGTIWYHVG